ncbi:dynein regulatory complex subunit 7 isoform X2 [Leptopilina boulardi]|uniref:dynein regulatory complex subunit 7 isoform X2 n=1 Tax=Leptopilina boulardi TaxID=63433 RepID=UPI0021F5CF5F|nr:dynein regulatory complex subunit 7 isoform X2 [Leptopilina boulardi]
MSEASKSYSGEYCDKSKFEEGHCISGGESDKIDYETKEKEQVDLKSVKITEETLKRICQQLCLIKLGFPSKVELDQKSSSSSSSSSFSSYLKLVPETYSQNSEKEKVLLWYAENFRRQFHYIYRNRKPLLMACDNECGIQKFVSTTIRRSTLPYPELSTWQGCAKFVSDYVTYEAPKWPHAMPERIRSPTWLTIFQTGNSFECSSLLASLLIGQGYNAYVVSGYASREQVNCDQTKRPCPFLPKKDDLSAPEKLIDTSKYQLKPPPNFQSQFEREMELEDEMALNEQLQREKEEKEFEIREFEKPLPDEYQGHRIHSWVIILPDPGGPRGHEIIEPFFIESSSGVAYMPKDEETNILYLGVESIWNDTNYWVNMQINSSGCQEINWNLSKVELWEHLLPGEPWTMRGIDDIDQEEDEEISIAQEKHLDMPGSYVNQIEIHSLDFERRYPNGKKTTFFKKTKVEQFAPYFNENGLIERVTIYDDYEYTMPIYCYEKYSNRKDKLIKSEKDLDTNMINDFYKRGRPDACKVHRYFSQSNDKVEDERTIEFYNTVRLDGLLRLQMHPEYMIVDYENREDFLYKREVQYSTECNLNSENLTNYREIEKITETFHRNEKIPAEENIAIREFAIKENEIRLKFHYNKGQYTRATRTFVKPSVSERCERFVFKREMVFEYNPNPMATEKKSLDLFNELQIQLEEEEKSCNRVRDAETEIKFFIKIQKDEISKPKLSVSIFDRNRNEKAKNEILEQEKLLKAEIEKEKEEIIDLLAPYVEKFGKPLTFSKEEALKIKDEFLKDFKQTQVDRANRMLHKINQGNQELQKMQTNLTQDEDISIEERENLRGQIDEMNIYLLTLEERLERHEKLIPERYKKMLTIIEEDVRFSVLQRLQTPKFNN